MRKVFVLLGLCAVVSFVPAAIASEAPPSLAEIQGATQGTADWSPTQKPVRGASATAQIGLCAMSIHGIFTGGSPLALYGYGNAACSTTVNRLGMQLCVIKDGWAVIKCKTSATDGSAVNGDVTVDCPSGFHDYELWGQGTAYASGGISTSNPIITFPIQVYCS
jgi:hypothetical protein